MSTKINYVKTVGRVEKTIVEDAIEATEQKVPERMEEYLPFIRFLYEKRDNLYELFVTATP